MIELDQDTLHFRFPEVHPRAALQVGFQRTLRLPDDDRPCPLPPGFGEFPLRHVDDHAGDLPPEWRRHGGVMLPMYQAEALWIAFDGDYPCAVKVAAGKVNAVTGEPWRDPLRRHPQDYLVAPEQPWLDGFVVARGEVRQFVAMPLGEGYTAEEQVTGRAEVGGLQIAVCPMRRDRYEALRSGRYVLPTGVAAGVADRVCESPVDRGLAPGGRLEQELFEDDHGLDAWEQAARSRCFVHIANSVAWAGITGEPPPTEPPTAADYDRAGLPWFSHYDADHRALAAMPVLAALRSATALHEARHGRPLPGDSSPGFGNTVRLDGPRPVREMGAADLPQPWGAR